MSLKHNGGMHGGRPTPSLGGPAINTRSHSTASQQQPARAGLANPGDACYAIAGLQALNARVVPLLTQVVLEEVVDADKTPELAKLQKVMWRQVQADEAADVAGLAEALGMKAGQQDVQEFLVKLIEMLLEQLSPAGRNKLEDMFRIGTTNINLTPTSNKIPKEQDSYIFRVSPNGKPGDNLLSQIQEQSRTTVKDKKGNDVEQKVLWTAQPAYLLVQVGRDAPHGKVLSKMAFPRVLKLGPDLLFACPDGKTYKLVGVVSHSGVTSHEGHFFVHTLEGGKWFIYDDRSVQPATSAQAVEGQFGADMPADGSSRVYNIIKAALADLFQVYTEQQPQQAEAACCSASSAHDPAAVAEHAMLDAAFSTAVLLVYEECRQDGERAELRLPPALTERLQGVYGSREAPKAAAGGSSAGNGGRQEEEQQRLALQSFSEPGATHQAAPAQLKRVEGTGVSICGSISEEAIEEFEVLCKKYNVQACVHQGELARLLGLKLGYAVGGGHSEAVSLSSGGTPAGHSPAASGASGAPGPITPSRPSHQAADAPEAVAGPSTGAGGNTAEQDSPAAAAPGSSSQAGSAAGSPAAGSEGPAASALFVSKPLGKARAIDFKHLVDELSWAAWPELLESRLQLAELWVDYLLNFSRRFSGSDNYHTSVDFTFEPAISSSSGSSSSSGQYSLTCTTKLAAKPDRARFFSIQLPTKSTEDGCCWAGSAEPSVGPRKQPRQQLLELTITTTSSYSADRCPGGETEQEKLLSHMLLQAYVCSTVLLHRSMRVHPEVEEVFKAAFPQPKPI